MAEGDSKKAAANAGDDAEAKAKAAEAEKAKADEEAKAKAEAEKKEAAAKKKAEEAASAKDEEGKPWLKPDYTGPLTASQAADRGRHLRMKGMRPDGSPLPK